MSFANYSARRVNAYLLPSVFKLVPQITERKFRNFEKKITALRAKILATKKGDPVVVDSLSELVYDFMMKDGSAISPRGRQPFHLTEFEKVKIGFYAQFLKRTCVADVMEINPATVKVYELAYNFPVA